RANQVHLLRRYALVVESESTQSPRGGGVGDQVHDLGAVAEPLELVGGEEGSPSVVGLVAEGPVELGRVTARFVDLEAHLRAIEDDGRVARRADRRAEQSDRGRRGAGGMRCKVETLDQLEASRLELAAERVGIRADLEVLVVAGPGGDAGSRMDDSLTDAGSLAGGEVLAVLPE